MHFPRIVFLGAALPFLAAAQTTLSPDAAPTELPKLEHFSAAIVDPSGIPAITSCHRFRIRALGR